MVYTAFPKSLGLPEDTCPRALSIRATLVLATLNTVAIPGASGGGWNTQKVNTSDEKKTRREIAEAV